MTAPIPLRPEKHEPIVGTFYLALLKQVLENRGYTLQGYQGPPEDLQDPYKRVSLATFYKVCFRSLADLPGGLGFDYGEQLNLIAADRVGQLIMSSATLGEAFMYLRRFHVLLSICCRVESQEGGDSAYIRFRDFYPVHTPPTLCWFASEALYTSLRVQASWLSGRPLRYRRVAVPFARPDHGDRYEAMFECPVEFGAPVHEVEFDRAYLDLAVLSGNAQLCAQKRRQCERALHRWQSRFSVKEQVETILEKTCPEFPTLDQVAHQLNTSRSCLYRKLQHNRTSYQCLINEFKRKRSVVLLKNTPMTVCEIAEQLGFSDASSFRRAFKSWTGLQPSALRERCRA